jgi:DNA-binding NtrC family response regulator
MAPLLQPDPNRPPRRFEPARVLIVEDDDDQRVLLQRILARLLPGVSVVTARDAQDALAVLQKRPVSLVLADYRLPGMDGLTLMDTLHAQFPGVQRVMMTGDPDHDLAVRATHDVGVQRFFVKPFRFEALARSIELMLKAERSMR